MTPTTGACPADARGAAVFYRAHGFAPVPIPTRAKRPLLPGWERFTLTDDDLDAHFPIGREMNVGNLNGAPSGGKVDVDLDCPEARRAAALLLPPTGMVTGRASAPDSHWWYQVTDGAPAKAASNFDDPTDAARGHLLELRSTGGQSVLPPSVYPRDAEKGHPTEERCVWHRRGAPGRVSAAELCAAVGAVAAATLLGRHWPTHRRNVCALAVGGAPLRAGWSVERAERFIRAVVAANGRDDELANRVGTVAHSAAALRTGANVTGWPTLAKALGAHGGAIVSAVREWLGCRSESPARAPAEPQDRAYTPLPEWRPFPVELLPAAVGAFVDSVARAMRCDPAFVALPALAACAGMIGSTRVIRLKRSWHEPPILWTAVVGESGALKSPPYRRAVAPVLALQAAAFEAHAAALIDYRREARDYERAKKANRGGDPGDPPTEPVCPRIYSRDTTIEALGPVLSGNRTRFLVGRDELSGWLSSFNQYKAKGGSDQANWLELHNLGTLAVDRKTGDPRVIFIPAVGTSVCGGIQPEVLKQALSAQHFSAGIPARVLFAYPPGGRKSGPKRTSTRAPRPRTGHSSRA